MNILLAALGKPGHGYDWSWVLPVAAARNAHGRALRRAGTASR